jgi:hypothetical protein
MRAKLFLTGIALTALTTIAFTQQPGSGQGQGHGKGKASSFVDANKNGICDNYENKTANIDGKSKNGTACMGGCSQRAGQGSGQNKETGRGKGRNFVDADKNGVCDYYEAATKK